MWLKAPLLPPFRYLYFMLSLFFTVTLSLFFLSYIKCGLENQQEQYILIRSKMQWMVNLPLLVRYLNFHRNLMRYLKQQLSKYRSNCYRLSCNQHSKIFKNLEYHYLICLLSSKGSYTKQKFYRPKIASKTKSKKQVENLY